MSCLDKQDDVSIHVATDKSYQVTNKFNEHVGVVKFHAGHPANGFNGFTAESLLKILIHRTKEVNVGNFNSPFNDKAIEHMEAALAALDARCADRDQRGVRNTEHK